MGNVPIESLTENASQSLLDVVGAVHLCVSASGDITHINAETLALLGYDRDELVGTPLTQILGQPIATGMLRQLSCRLSPDMRIQLIGKQEQRLEVVISTLPLRLDQCANSGTELVLWAVPTVDVTGGDAVDDYLCSAVGDGIVLTDADWQPLMANTSFMKTTGLDLDSLLARSLPDLMPQCEEFNKPHDDGVWQCEVRGEAGDGCSFVVSMTAFGIGQPENPSNYLVTVKEITRPWESDVQVNKLAYFDSLTGLANRHHLIERAEKAIGAARRRGARIALLFLDLDGFKDINDSHGHEAGDEVLCVISERLKKTLRPSDFIGRLGGDEFCIVQEDVVVNFDPATLAKRCIDVISQPVKLSGRDIRPGVSVGIALCPDDGADRESLFSAADSAMYSAKRDGGRRYAFYSPEMTRQAERRLSLEHDFRESIARQEFGVRYQPQVALRGGAVTAVEAVVQWQRPGRTEVPATQFYEIGERIGLAVKLDEWVLQSVCRDIVAWREAGHSDIRVAVDVSGSHFRSRRIEATVLKVIGETGIDPRALMLEATETVIQEGSDVVEALTQLRRMGVSISLDNFGTGVSSLGALRRLPIDYLKMDREFVHDLLNAPHGTTIIASIIAMGRSLGFAVLADGVESFEQIGLLAALGCHAGQGAFFSEPVSADDVGRLLETDFLPEREGGNQVGDPGTQPAQDAPHGSRIQIDLSADDQLPALGGHISDLIEVVSDDDVDHKRLVETIERCPSIAARLVFLANSAWAAPKVPITSLDLACANLGLRLVRSVSIGLAVASPFDPTRCPEFDGARFWSSALAVADGAVRLSEVARDSRELDPQTLYTAGLLHSLGLLWLADKHPEAITRAMRSTHADVDPLNDVLRQAVGVDYCEVGGVLARALGLPEVLASAMEHHADSGYLGRYWPTTSLVGAAAEMVSARRRGAERTPPIPRLQELGISESDQQLVFEDLRAKAESTYELAQQLFVTA